MKLKILDDDHLLAILTAQEAETLGIFEADRTMPLRFHSFHSRLAAAKILSIACSGGFACEGRRITLRALPSQDEERVLLLFTLAVVMKWARCPWCGGSLLRKFFTLKVCPHCHRDLITGKRKKGHGGRGRK